MPTSPPQTAGSMVSDVCTAPPLVVDERGNQRFDVS
jgi:hypothetical protein